MTVTADNWNVDSDGDWATAADWSTGKVPTSNNTVTLSTTDVHTITHSTGSDTIDALTVGQDVLDLSGGSLDILTTASFADGYTQTGGTLQVGAISVTGPAMLMGGASEGSTSFTVKGLTTLSNYTLGGASKLAVASTADQTNQITLGDANGVGAAINIASGATYDIAGDFGVTDGAASGTITNAGTLEKGSGSGTSTVAASVTNTGTLTSVSGTLELSGPTNTVSGTLSGAGQIAFGGGVTTLGKATVTVGTIGLYGTATLDLAASADPTSVFTDSSNGMTTLNVGAYTFTLKGASASIAGNFGIALVTGSGTFANESILTLGGGNEGVEFGGTLAIQNKKTIDQVSAVTLGDGSGSAPSLTNEAGSVYDFANDSSLAENGTTVAFDNLGTLEKTGTGGASAVGLAVTNAGTISAQSGALQFDNTLVDSGAISGAATVQITGGVASLNSGATLTVANFDIFDAATVNVNTALTYAGVFDDSSDGADDLDLAANLTLTGKSNTIAGSFGTADISGAGMLINQGTLTLSDGNEQVVIDGTTKIDNTGIINQAQTVTIGGVGGQVASIVNASGATYNLSGAYTLDNGEAAGSHFDNSGAFDVNAGTGTATLTTTFNNLSGATVAVTAGALQTTGIFNNAGTISGTQFIAQNGSTYLNSGTSLTVQQFDIYADADVTLGGSVSYSGTFADASNGTTTLNLGGYVLSLKGASSFAASFGSDDVNGSGTLYVEKAGLISEGNGDLVIGGTVKFEVGAAETVTGNVQIGDGSANAATMEINSAGTYDFTADAGVSRGQAANSSITNDGLFEKTAGTGTSEVSVDFVNDGTITVTSGTLEFAAGTLTNKGTINGKETTDSNGDILITAASGGSSRHATAAGPSQTASSVALLVQAAAAFDPPSSGASMMVWRGLGLDGTLLAASHALRA